MSTGMFYPAERRRTRLRMAIDGPAGAGKTFTALRFAFAMSRNVAVIDTEHESAAKYQGESPDGIPWNFQICPLRHFAPSTYTQAVKEAGRLRFDVLVVDSLSHAWQGIGGALEQVSKASGNAYTAWKDVTPQHNEMVESILASPCHVICTLRSKMDYVLETDDHGKMVPRKVGMAPIQRNGMEYEFDAFCDMDISHTLHVSKTRCSPIDGLTVSKPDGNFMAPVIRWLESGSALLQSIAESKNGASDEQRNRIIAIAEQVGMPEQALVEALGRRGASRIAELTYMAAEDLYDNLFKVRMNQEVQSRF